MDLALDLARPSPFIVQDQPSYRPCLARRMQDQVEVDPLSADRPDDLPVITTERRLRRIAMLAADTGARFSREGIDHDAAAWMMAPRALFDGASAIEACQDLEHFARGTLLHGLSIGLDADPDLVDALLDDEAAAVEILPEAPLPQLYGVPVRLFTSFVQGPIGYEGRQVNAFCAMTCVDSDTFRRRLRARFGTELGDATEIVEGIDRTHPLSSLLMSNALLSVLDGDSGSPSRACEAGFDLVIDLRYLA